MKENLDKKPWYKQFWPWVIIGLPLLSVIGGTTSAYLAYKYADDIVLEEKYAPLDD